MPSHNETWISPVGARRVCVAFGALWLATAVACGSDSSGPSDPLSKVPRFVYVSNASGDNQLYTWDQGTTALFPASVAGDVEPQSAAGKVVFTSYRISYLNAEIYITNLDGSNAIRLTDNPGPDYQPSLSPTGTKVVFSSLRSGTTQIWVMPAAGGAATQVTHEANGAFDGSWSPDGQSIFYVDGVDRTKIHKIVVATGAESDYITGGDDVGDAACTSHACIVVTGATGTNKNIVAYVGANTDPISLLQTDKNEYEPAILKP